MSLRGALCIVLVHAISLQIVYQPGLYPDWSRLVLCRLHGIYPVQNMEAMRQNMQYMKLVAYFKRIEEDFFNSCRSKVCVYVCNLVCADLGGCTYIQYNLKDTYIRMYDSAVLSSISSLHTL